jgi:hypothetical protein
MEEKKSDVQRKRAHQVLNFLSGPKRQKNAVKELLNLDRLRLLCTLIAEEAEEDASQHVENFLTLFTSILVCCSEFDD